VFVIFRGYASGCKKEFVAAFRESFARLGELRSLCPQNPVTPVLALTATASKDSQATVMESLCMRKNCLIIYKSPNRPNIYLAKFKVSMDVRKSFKFLIDKLRLEKIAMDRTIVYCKSIKDCGHLFHLFRSELGDHSFYPSGSLKLSSNLLFGMYHHTTLDKHKSRILNSFHEQDGTCRLVFATNALGMGVNFPDVRTVINYGPPREVEEFLQEIGRAGRDGKCAQAVLLFHGHQLKNCDKEIIDYCNSASGCLRKKLLSSFEEIDVESFSSDTYRHNCCLHCHKECTCMGEKKCQAKLLDLSVEEMDKNSEQLCRTVTNEQNNLIKEIIQYIPQSLLTFGLSSYLSPGCATAYNTSLTKTVLNHAKYIFTIEYIMDNLPVFNKSVAVSILYMMQDIFGDIPATVLQHAEDEKSLDVLCVSNKEYDLEYGGVCVGISQEESSYDEVALNDN
jgi:ATP-dependent DNA helicase RecQ